MLRFENQIEAASALREYVYGKGTGFAAIDAKLKEAAGHPSIVQQIARTAEILYANSDTINKEGKELCADLASFATQNGWSKIGRDGRGEGVVAAMNRKLKKKLPSGKKHQPKEKDPEPLGNHKVSG